MLINTSCLEVKNRIKKYLNSGDSRSVEAKKNILFSFANKGLSVVVSFLLVTVTLQYVDSVKYGIWLTISSIVGWASFFDFGFAHGFRNKFAEAKAKGDKIMMRKYLSTTYAVLFIIFGLIFIIGAFVNSFIHWSKVLNVNEALNEELSIVFFILILFFCIQYILNIITTLLLADQKAAFSSFITTLGQLFVLIVIYLLTLVTKGDLIYLAYSVSVVPCVVFLILSIYLFKTKYKEISPKLSLVDFHLTKPIIGLGSKFFLIQISMLIIFQFSNIILSREIGPNAVTEFNITYKYFSVIYLICLIVFSPFWSAFTDAYTTNDLSWMKEVYKKLSKYWYLSVPTFLIMFLVSPWVFKLWIGNTVHISLQLSFIMGLYILVLSRANLYMYLINGTGKVFMQLLVFLFFSLISVPLMILFSRNWGVEGLILVPIIVYVFQSMFGHIQINKIINNTASGIWNK